MLPAARALNGVRGGPAGGELDGQPDAAAVRAPAALEAGRGAGSREAAVDLVDAEADDRVGRVRCRRGMETSNGGRAAADQAPDVGLLAGGVAAGDDDVLVVGEVDVGPAQGRHLAPAQRTSTAAPATGVCARGSSPPPTRCGCRASTAPPRSGWLPPHDPARAPDVGDGGRLAGRAPRASSTSIRTIMAGFLRASQRPDWPVRMPRHQAAVGGDEVEQREHDVADDDFAAGPADAALGHRTAVADQHRYEPGARRAAPPPGPEDLDHLGGQAQQGGVCVDQAAHGCAAIRWEHIDFESGRVTLPETKTGRRISPLPCRDARHHGSDAQTALAWWATTCGLRLAAGLLGGRHRRAARSGGKRRVRPAQPRPSRRERYASPRLRFRGNLSNMTTAPAGREPHQVDGVLGDDFRGPATGRSSRTRFRTPRTTG